MTISDTKDKVVSTDEGMKEKDTSDGDVPIESRDNEDREYDVVSALQDADHITKTYPNGLTLGIRFNPIRGSRAIHVDMIYVLDWRRSKFPKNEMAMKSAILEILNQSIGDVFSDFELDHRLDTIQRRTANGQVRLQVFRDKSTGKMALLRKTRSVYIVTKDTPPAIDLSWLTDPGRVVSADNFSLARRSDMRSTQPEIEQRVNSEKWKFLQSGVELSWVGLLLAVFCVISFATVFYVLFRGTSSTLFPTIAGILGLLASLYTTLEGRKRIIHFNELMATEDSEIERVADDCRIRKAKQKDEDILDSLRTLRFVISPLMARVVGSLNVGDFQGSNYAAERVLDELVRLSPYEEIDKGSDAGLNKFLTIFQHLDPEYDEASLSMSYVAITNPSTDVAKSGKIMGHVNVLLESLYRCGIVLPDAKSRMDEMLSVRGMKEFKGTLDKEFVERDDENTSHEIEGDDISEDLIAPSDSETVGFIKTADVNSPKEYSDENMNDYSDTHPGIPASEMKEPVSKTDSSSLEEVEQIDENGSAVVDRLKKSDESIGGKAVD